MASPGVKPSDPALNDHIMYAKCIKGHVLKDADDWILCENLPAPDARCWQEERKPLQARQKPKGIPRLNQLSPEDAWVSNLCHHHYDLLLSDWS